VLLFALKTELRITIDRQGNGAIERLEDLPRGERREKSQTFTKPPVLH
jgi:hypothetical protein